MEHGLSIIVDPYHRIGSTHHPALPKVTENDQKQIDGGFFH
jgi:hypothetical protein